MTAYEADKRTASRALRRAGAVILGAGISGLVAAKILGRQGQTDILMIDAYDHVGGNHISCDFGPYTFDIGTLIFQDDSPLMNYFPELLPYYHPIDWSISRVAPDNVVRAYPLSMRDEIFGTGPVGLFRIFASIAWGRLRSTRFANAEEYARYWIGSRLFASLGLAGYIRRFYGAPASAIDPMFAQKRMGWLAEGGSVKTQVRNFFARRRARKTQTAGNQSFVRPRAGFGTLYGVARQTLEQEGTGFALGETIEKITRDGAQFRIQTGRLEIICDRLISTIPVEQAYALCGLGEPGQLPYRTLVTLFFSFAGDRGFGATILYNFALDGDWKRLTMFSEFFGQVEGRQYFGVEVTTADSGPGVAEREAAAFIADVAKKGLFKGSLRFEGSHALDHAYPVYLHGAQAMADGMIGALRAFGVESMGRQGGFDYLPTARQVTLEIERQTI